MWPFKKKPNENQPIEKYFLIHEEANKEFVRKEILLELMAKHMEVNKYGDLVLPRVQYEAMPKALGEHFDKVWEKTLQSYETEDIGHGRVLYLVGKRKGV